MPTGQEARRRDAIVKHLAGFDRGAQDAGGEAGNCLGDGKKGLHEAAVCGTHSDDWSRTPATGRNVRVPIAVAYHVEDGLSRTSRIYLMANVLIQQISGAS